MKMLTSLRAATFKTIAGTTLAGVALSLPTLAQAQSYGNGYYNPSQDCRKQEDNAQLVGGLLGAVVGGVIGSQVSGNGARTEGSAVGAVIGGLAGAGIGDESVDCDKRRRQSYTSRTYQGTRYNAQTYGRTAPIVYGGTTTTTRIYQPVRTVTDRNIYRVNTRGFAHGNRYRYNETRAQLDDVRFRLQNLRAKERRISNRLRNGYSPRLVNRHAEVCREIDRLQRKKYRLMKRLRNQNVRYR